MNNSLNLTLSVSHFAGSTISRQHYSTAQYYRVRDRYAWIKQLVLLQQLKSFI